MEGLIILVVLALAAIQVILPIVSLVIASRTRARLQALEEATARLRDELDTLTTRVHRARTAPVVTPEAAAPETGGRAPRPHRAPRPAPGGLLAGVTAAAQSSSRDGSRAGRSLLA